MKPKLLPIIIFILLAGIPLSIKAQDARLIAKNTFPSVVMLEMRDGNNRAISLGSGFFVRPDVVVTNYHVIEGASNGFAKVVGDDSIYHIEGVVGFDKTMDLALLKLKGVTGRPLVLADISKIEVGEEIFALGNPRGLEGTISPGIISGSSLRDVGNGNLLQITAPISPGSSGGPVVNKKGEVLGIAVSSLKDGQNLNFAIPSSYLAVLLASSKSAPISLSSIKRSESERLAADSEPSLAETTSWITEKLIGRSMLLGENNSGTLSNAHIFFDGCIMTSTTSHSVGDITGLNTYVVSFKAKLDPWPSSDEKQVYIFAAEKNDTLPHREDIYISGNLTESAVKRDAGPVFVVNERELGLRVVKAFKQVIKLCNEKTKKEPF